MRAEYSAELEVFPGKPDDIMIGAFAGMSQESPPSSGSLGHRL
jgi:hypothetical protein